MLTLTNSYKLLQTLVILILLTSLIGCSSEETDFSIDNEEVIEKSILCPPLHELEVEFTTQANFRKNCVDSFNICVQIVLTFDCVRWQPPEEISDPVLINKTPQYILDKFDNNNELLTYVMYSQDARKVLLFVDYDLNKFDDVVPSDFDEVEIDGSIETNFSSITLKQGVYQKNILNDGNLLYIIDVE